MINIPYNSLLSCFSEDPHDRSLASTIRMTFCCIAIVGVSIVTTNLLAANGGEANQGAWSNIAIIYSIILFVCFMITFLVVRETVTKRIELASEQARKAGAKSNTYSTKAVIKASMSNKYFYLIFLMFLVMFANSGMMGIGVYYARDVLGNSNFFGTLTIAQMAPIFLAQFIIPLLLKKISKRAMCMAGGVLVIISSLLFLVNPYSSSIVLICYLLRGLGIAPFMGLLFTYPADLVDYVDWKNNGMRSEGFAYASSSFGNKVGAGLGAALVGWFLSIGNYDANLTKQTARTLNSLISLQVGGYLVIGIILFMTTLLWDFEKFGPTMRKELVERKSITG
jgi:GPH family glycoside/pentoside/hexuronide:cation symporter